MSSPFQRAFSSKSPLNSNHGPWEGTGSKPRSQGYNEAGQIIDTRTGMTQEEMLAKAAEDKAKQEYFTDEYGAYQKARSAHKDLDPFMTDPNEYDKSQAYVDSLRSAYDKLVLPTNETDISLDN